MNEWLLAATILTSALAPLALFCARAELIQAIVGLELAGVLAPAVLLLMAAGFDREPFVDLALVLGLLSPIGSLLYVRYLEGGP